MGSKEEYLENRESYFAQFFIGVVVVAALFLISCVVYEYVGTFGFDRSKDQAIWGQFGDYVGGLTNPALSFLALLVLLQTFRMQLKESKKTSKSLQRQLDIIEREKFENTFFKLLDRVSAHSDTHLQAINSQGSTLASRLKGLLRKNTIELDKLEWREGVTASIDYISKVLKKDWHRTHAFARRASQCLYFIDESNLLDSEKEFYITLFLNSFEKYELSLYLTISFAYSEKTVTIVRKYGLAKGVSVKDLCSKHAWDVFHKPDISSVYPIKKNRANGDAEAPS